MIQYTTANGKTYQLRMRDGDYFYRWYGDGQLHPILKGAYTDIKLGEIAMEKYIREIDSKKTVKTEPTLKDELDQLSKKKDLLIFARKNNFSVPEHLKFPVQIKKYLLSQVEV